tara:strand:- start:3359 stop:3961 length:603 start_codon:yes stop_codon:yes gene_type:complete
MKYFYLLFLLPPDLVNHIYLINLKNSSVNKIIHKFRYNKLCHNIIKSIYNFINTDIYKIIDKNILYDYIVFLDFVVKFNFPKKYNKLFWLNLLNLISKKLGEIHTRLIMNNSNTNSNNNYKNLKIIIKLWFKICQKYYIKLQFSEYINKRKDVKFIIRNSTSIIKLLDFSKYFTSPRVVDYNDNSFNFHDNFTFIQQFIN